MIAGGQALAEAGLPIPQQALFWILFAVWILGLPLVALRVCDRIRTHVFARMALECWNDPPPARAPVDPRPRSG